ARLASDEPRLDASPVVEAVFPVADRPGVSLRVLGIDVFRAANVTPALVPTTSPGERDRGEIALFADDTIFLSNAALAELSLAEGDTVRLLAGGRPVSLRIAGTVGGAGQSLAVMDIGTMQWRLGWLGQLSRIDLRFGS